MNYNFSEMRYPSSDGKSTVYTEIYTPRLASSRAVVQLAHGMIDYVGRYRELADYLTARGFILIGNHHLGHGKTATSEDELGFFAERDGAQLVIKDMLTLNEYIHRTFPTLPVFIMGHSMGSFLARLYVEKHPRTVSGAIFHGTAGPNPALPAGRLLASLIIALRGSHHRSALLKSLSIGAYQKAFESEGKNAWLTRVAEQVADHDDDPYSNFDFTASGYRDLFWLLSSSNRKGWYSSLPKSMPMLVMSGEDDPVGNYGKGPRHVYKNLLLAGCADVTLKTYGKARHELFKEENRAEVFSDLVGWLDSAMKNSRI